MAQRNDEVEIIHLGDFDSEAEAARAYNEAAANYAHCGTCLAGMRINDVTGDLDTPQLPPFGTQAQIIARIICGHELETHGGKTTAITREGTFAVGSSAYATSVFKEFTRRTNIDANPALVRRVIKALTTAPKCQ